MAFAFPSLLTRNILQFGPKSSQSRFGQLVFQHSSLNFSVPVKTTNQLRFQHTFQTFPFTVVRTSRANGSREKKSTSLLLKGAIVAGVGLGLANQRKCILYCEEPNLKGSNPSPPVYPEGRGPPPTSSVSVYELGFGTVAGVCAGVFVKKGAKAVAWFLGGIFVLLQYLRSTSLVRVDWGRMSNRFENLFYSKDPLTGESRAPNVFSLWNWLINFLTSDFQPRASFIAGFALGLRVG